MVQSVSELRCLFTDALSGNKPSKVIELEGYTPPPTFATAMLKLSPCQERTTSVFIPRSKGNVDGFYGHRSVAKASSAFITNTFGCPEESLLSKLFSPTITPLLHRFHHSWNSRSILRHLGRPCSPPTISIPATTCIRQFKVDRSSIIPGFIYLRRPRILAEQSKGIRQHILE